MHPNQLPLAHGVATDIPEPETKTLIVPLEYIEEQGIVIVHCRFQGGGAIRVWHSTFLIDRGSEHRSKLLHVENIALFPQWTIISENSGIRFTLFFEALPKSCTQFDLHEIISQPGGFFIEGIKRNELDVYQVEIV